MCCIIKKDALLKHYAVYVLFAYLEAPLNIQLQQEFPQVEQYLD